MQKPKSYNIQPSRGQALLSFQGRRFPDKVELFETEIIEEVRQKRIDKEEKQKDLNSDFRNLLIHGDALSACAYLKDKNIKLDLVYIDPPFASGANYAKKINLRNISRDEVESDNSIGEEVMYGDIWQKEDYLNWLYERLLAIREVMNEKACIYVHLDWHIGHYVKLLLDEVFGEENFLNEIIWAYRERETSDRNFNKKHDNIYFYAKDLNSSYVFNANSIREEYSEVTISKFKYTDKDGRKYRLRTKDGKSDPKEESENTYRQYLDEVSSGVLPRDWFVMPFVNQAADEREDYSTQKPEAILEKFIKASSDENMIVADFFVGSGTTAKVAGSLKRKFVACDVGINAIQTTRDRLIKAGAEFDVLKIKDGVRLFRNPTQTTAKIFSLIDGFQTRKELELSEFWDGGVADKSAQYIPVKFIGIDKRLTKELLDIVLEEIYQLQDSSSDVAKAQLIYAYKDDEINQTYINKQISNAGKTTIKLELVNLDELLASKRDLLYMPDSADIELNKEKDGYKVTIKRFFSPYLKTKIDDYNNKKVRKTKQTTIDEEQEPEQPKKKVTISDTGLELIEAVQFDTTLKKDVWTSNLELEDKAGVKEKIKGEYLLPTDKFLMKIRNIAGDEIIIDSSELNSSPKS